MENKYVISGGELYHYGRKGMRWGMNIFGKIKAYKAKKKRLANLKKAREVRAERKRLISSGKLSSKQMTDAELKARINRLQMEKTYNDLLKSQKSATSSRAKTFMNKFFDSTLDKVADNAGADVVAQALKVLTVKGVNKMAGSEVVFTNNKKK